MLISLTLAIGACAEERPLDCSWIDVARLDQCTERNEAKGQVGSFVACFPFSKRLFTKGVWVVGFEKNDFFEGPRPPPADVMWNESTGASLMVESAIRQKIAPAGPEFRAFEVDVVGRRALCPTGEFNQYPIAVERLKVRRRLGSR